MTQPLGVGFPDFARQASEAQVLEINDNNVTGNGSVFYPGRYVGNAKALMVWANPTTMPCEFLLRFSGDQAGTIPMDNFTFDADSLLVARQTVPILGPYMSAVVEPKAAGNFQYTFQVWRVPAPGNFQGGPSYQSSASQFNTAVGAGATVDTTDFMVAGTPVTWSVSCTAASWQASVISRLFDGTEQILDFVDNTFTPKASPRTIYAPPTTLVYRVHNFDAGAKNFFLFATRDLRP